MSAHPSTIPPPGARPIKGTGPAPLPPPSTGAGTPPRMTRREREEKERQREKEERERERERRRRQSGSGKKEDQLPKPPPQVMPAQFDFYDRAPEDRHGTVCHRRDDFFFGPYDPVVRGSLHIEGVNYAKYEAQKHRHSYIAAFLDAIRDDLISEVGNGVRREDILLQLYPGAIKTVVLHYDRYDGPDPKANDPTLVDAEWNVKCDYAIRARDVQRQQNIAMALYTALSEEQLFSVHKMRRVYMDKFDPNCDPGKLRIVRPPDFTQELQALQPPVPLNVPQQQPPQQRVLASPQRGAAPMLPYPVAGGGSPASLCPPGTAPVISVPPPAGTAGLIPAGPAPQAFAHQSPADEVFDTPSTARPRQTPLQAPLPPPQSHLLPRDVVTTSDGWAEYGGRRGVALFIPEDTLYANQQGITPARMTPQIPYTKTPPSAF